MADQAETNGGTQNHCNGEKSTPKQSRFRKSTVIGLGREQLKRGTTELQLPVSTTMNNQDKKRHFSLHNSALSGTTGDDYLKSGNPEPVLPMFVQMNVRWDGVDKSWREASR